MEEVKAEKKPLWGGPYKKRDCGIHADLFLDESMSNTIDKNFVTNSNKFSLKITGNRVLQIKNSPKNGKITVYNLLGKAVIQKSLNGIDKIPLKSLNSAVYLVNIKGTGINSTQKIVLK